MMVSILTFIGCMNKKQLLKKERMQLDSLVNKQHWSTTRFSIKSKDSSVNRYELEIWPKGKFTYTNLGFEGEAYRMNVRGLQEKKNELEEQSQQIIKSEEHNERKQISQNKEKDLHKQSLSLLPLLGLCLLVAAVCAAIWFVYKRLKA